MKNSGVITTSIYRTKRWENEKSVRATAQNAQTESAHNALRWSQRYEKQFFNVNVMRSATTTCIICRYAGARTFVLSLSLPRAYDDEAE